MAGCTDSRSINLCNPVAWDTLRYTKGKFHCHSIVMKCFAHPIHRELTLSAVGESEIGAHSHPRNKA